MTLLELSGEYRASAAALRERVLLLEHRLRGVDGDGRRLLERGYCRNGKYTL